MKCDRFPRILTVAVTLALLVVIIPATPALAAPVINLSPSSGAIGTEVTVTGTNFESYSGDYISVFFDNAEIGGEVVPGSGSFAFSFQIPDDADIGRAYITVEDEYGNRLGERRPFIIDDVEIELYPGDGTLGATVTVKGRGFYAGDRVTFHYDEDGGINLGTGTATATGEITFTFAVPEGISGNHEVTAQDILGNSAGADFKMLPSVVLEPVSGAMGDEITVTGTGFGYKSDVVVSLGNIKVAEDSADKHGSFEVVFSLPIMKPGTYDVEVEDEEDNTTRAEFIIGAGISLSPVMGNVATPVIISGTGFVGGDTVTVTYDAVEVASATPDGNGAFSVVFNAPVSISGNHPVIITDGINIAKRTFTMESAPPPAPVPLLPGDGAKVDDGALFDWEEVTDDSLPLTYTLQIASGKDFVSLELKAEGLTDTKYTLPEKELLPTKDNAPYYWRVRAVDGASNAGEWSPPVAFGVGASFSVPGGVIIALIVLGVLGLGILTFWLGRRTAYYRERYPREVD
ncbi:IPT/TIG domain-containing protein [Chloroflexota bacterium]